MKGAYYRKNDEMKIVMGMFVSEMNSIWIAPKAIKILKEKYWVVKG